VDIEPQEYNFTLHHKPGKTNVKVDLLSDVQTIRGGRMTMNTSQCSNQSGFQCMEVGIDGQDKTLSNESRSNVEEEVSRQSCQKGISRKRERM